MDDLLELIFTLCEAIISNSKFKNPRVRTWVFTGFYSALGLLLVGVGTGGAIGLYQQGSTVGTVVLSIIALIALIVSGVIIFRGHKSNWVKH